MNDQDKTREQLIEELAEFRGRVAGLEAQLARSQQAEETLRRSEAKWRAVAENAPLFLASVDQSGKMDSLNRFQPGFAPESVFRRSVYDFLQADEALRQSEAKYRALVESCPDAVAMKDLQGRIVFASQRAAEQQGALDPDELVGTLAEDWVIESERERFRYGSRLLFEQGVRRNDQYTGLRNDGTTFAAELSSAVIRDAAGNPVGLMGVYRDVTERKQAEEKLAILGRFVEAATQGFGMVDLEGRIIYINPMMAGWLGEEKPEDAFGKEASTYHTSEFPGKFDAVILPALRQNGYWQGELPLVRRNGTVIPTLYNIFPLRDKSGSIYRHAAVVTDITELKRAEEALGQSHDELRAIYDGMPDGLLVADLETKQFVRCNASMRRMLGYSEEELLSRSVMDIHPADEMPRVLEAFQALVEGRQRMAQDIPVLRKDGTVFHADVTHHEITLNGQRCTVGFFRDIQERRLAQEELRQSYQQLQVSKDRYELAVRGAGVGIWDWDIRTGMLLFSPRWKALFGYGEGDIGHGLEDWVRLLHPDERERITKFLEDFLAGTSSIITVEYRLRHKDGSYRWIMAHAVVVRDDQGRAVRMVGSHGDITDRKLAEEKVKAEQRALRRMVLATDHERRLITYELHDGVAQQLLGALMYFQAVEAPQGRKSKTADTYRDGLAALRQAAAEIRRVMNWLRTPVLEKFGLVAGIDDVASQLRSAPEAPEIEYRHAVKFQRLEPTLENTLFRIAQEAMTNACRHSQSEKVCVTLTQDGDEVTLEVQDWGIGFDKDAVVENHYGLDGIRQRSEIQGGRLTIKSKPGQGTVIAVTLPVVEAADPD